MHQPGELAIVLHTHMPYVEGYGTWPFGEEWLWEAAATSYVPLLDLLDELGTERTRRELTLSLTPVLCDQLALAEAMRRCVAFLGAVRPESHRLDIEEFERNGAAAEANELRRGASEYAAAGDRIAEVEASGPGGLLRALGKHAKWTSSATHAILPLLMLDEAIDLQIQTGIESYRQRFGDWDGGFWLPECAHSPGLGHHLTEAGVRTTCVELTSLLGLGGAANLHPRQADEGPLCWPIDRQTIDLVWGPAGYPSRAAYRDTNRLTAHRHQVWANDGSVYDPERAAAQAREDAAEFVAAARERVSAGGVSVFAIDTELLGHWWHEGVQWLRSVIEQAERQNLRLTALDDAAIDRHRPREANLLASVLATSWGRGNDLRTWSGPAVADFAWRARQAEILTFAGEHPPSETALRELLALQASDWAFLEERGWAGDYPRQRYDAHLAALTEALAQRSGSDQSGVRAGLAPWLHRS